MGSIAMKRITFILALSLCTTPAFAGLLSAANLLKVAGVVLKGRAVLNQGQTTCGNQLALAPQENLLVQAATGAVQKLLPAPKFLSLDNAASAAAKTAATSPTFCQQTVAKKPGILGSIGDAAKQLGVGGGLGGLGGILGGGSTTAPSTGSTATDVLGGLLGGTAPK
jgi:hypothetical protein